MSYIFNYDFTTNYSINEKNELLISNNFKTYSIDLRRINCLFTTNKFFKSCSGKEFLKKNKIPAVYYDGKKIEFFNFKTNFSKTNNFLMKKLKHEDFKTGFGKQLMIRKANNGIYSIVSMINYETKENNNNPIIRMWKNFFKEIRTNSIKNCKNYDHLLEINKTIDNYMITNFNVCIRDEFKADTFEFDTKRKLNPNLECLFNEVSALYAMGIFSICKNKEYDPFYGIYPDKKNQKFSTMISSLMTIIKPYIYFFCLDLINGYYIEPEDFKKNNGLIRLKEKSLLIISKLFSEKIIHGKNSFGLGSAEAFLDFTIEKGVYL
ncbi:MAG: CRISPR-associated endonuclease Cas1 [Candidatus Muiribacteriota bacterium]